MAKEKKDPWGASSDLRATKRLEGAVASFFTPASQKPKEQTRTLWSERAPDEDTPATLLVGRYEPAAKEENGDGDAALNVKRRKIAAFDLVRVHMFSLSRPLSPFVS